MQTEPSNTSILQSSAFPLLRRPHTGTGQFRTHASCGGPQRGLSPTKRPGLGGEMVTQAALQTNLVTKLTIFTSCMKQPSQSTCNPVRNCKSYCMEQPSVGRKSYTYKATDLDR